MMDKLYPRDIDFRYPIEQTPFYLWLTGVDEPDFTVALRRYLKLGLYGQHPDLNGHNLNCYACIHKHRYWVLHNEEQKQ